MSRATAPLLVQLRRGTRLWRGHDVGNAATAYNPTHSVTRFTPVHDASGAVVPYLYLGESDAVAIAESALHDVTGRMRVIMEAKLFTLALSEVTLTRDITLIDLTGHGLKRVRQSLAALIATSPSEYQRTAAVAQELLGRAPSAEGLLYPSQMFPTGRAAILYQRSPRRTAPLRRVSTISCGAGEGRARVDAACATADVTLVR